MEALPQGYLIIVMQRFELNRADAVEINYFFEHLEIRLQTPNNRSLFLIIFWVNVQRNSHQLKHNDQVIGLFVLGLLQIRIPAYAHAQILAMTNHWIQLYNLVLYYAFEIMITMPFYLDLSGKNFCLEILRWKNFKQKLRHEVVEAEAIQKLPLSHPWLWHKLLWRNSQIFMSK